MFAFFETCCTFASLINQKNMPQLKINGELREVTHYPSFFKDQNDKYWIVAAPNLCLAVHSGGWNSHVERYDSMVLNKEDDFLTEVSAEEVTTFAFASFNRAMERFTIVFNQLQTKPRKPQNRMLEDIV